MSKPAKGNVSFQITMTKDTRDNLVEMVKAVNDLHDPSIGHVTLSNFIEKICIAFIVDVHTEQKEKNSKGEKKNA